MVTKRKPAQKNVKVGKLKLNKETVKDLSKQDAKAVRGGIGRTLSCVAFCQGGPAVPTTNICGGSTQCQTQ